MAIVIDEKQAKLLERKPLIFFMYVLMAVIITLYSQMQYERNDSKAEISRLNGIILQQSKDWNSGLRESNGFMKEIIEQFSIDKYYEKTFHNNRTDNIDSTNPNIRR